MQLDRLIEGFFLDCRARNLSSATIQRAYTPVLLELADWLGNPQVDDVITDDLRHFVVSLGDDRGLSAWTVHRYVRVIKRLFNWTVLEGITQSNPSEGLAYPKLPQQAIQTLSKNQIELMLNEAKGMSFRDYAICLVLLDSGLRRQELCDLHLDDVSLTTGLVRVQRGKGGKARQVRVGKLARRVLWRYVNQYRPEGGEHLFLSRRGQPLTGNAVAQMFRRLSRRVGFRVHAHLLRHTFATRYALQVPNAVLLADALGHTSLEMARRYVHLAGTQSTDIVSPMNEMFAQLGDGL